MTALTGMGRRKVAAAFAVVVATAALLAGLWGAASPVSSDVLVQAEPAPGDRVAELPEKLLLTFDLPLAQLVGAQKVTVRDQRGQVLFDDVASISTYSRRTLIVPLEGSEEASRVTVSFDVQFDQGDDRVSQLRETYSFRVDRSLLGLEGEGAGGGASALDEPKSSQALVLWTVAVLIGIAAAGAMVYFLRVATGTSRSSLEPMNRTVFRD